MTEAEMSPQLNELTQGNSWRFRLTRFAIGLSILLVLAFLIVLWIAAPIICTYSARLVSTGTFLQNRDLQSIKEHDLAIMPIVSVTVDRKKKLARASLGPFSRTAVFRPGVGACVAVTQSFDELRKLTLDSKTPKEFEATAWPEGNKVEKDPKELGVNIESMNEALDWAFSEPNPNDLRRTRAVVVLYKGELVAERYVEGFDKTTPILGWSMTKSVLSTLIGRAVKLGKLDISKPAPIAEWQGANDPRKAITVDQLLRMSDGLDFQEQYFNPFSDVLNMLFVTNDVASYAASRPAKFKPDERWYYSSGSSNILSRVLAQSVGNQPIDSLKFARTQLFEPLNMYSARIETDETGTMIASSYMYATARDWARFGQFCLQNGRWNGKQLLPENWMSYATTPTPKAPRGRYGAHFWLNAGTGEKGEDRYWSQLPRDGYYASGFQGQCCFVIPSRNCVVIRLGVTNNRKAWSHGDLVSRVLKALPEME